MRPSLRASSICPGFLLLTKEFARYLQKETKKYLGGSFVELILASASPRRKELLEQIGLKARILVPQVDESRVSASAPASLTMELAQLKAKDVVARYDWSQGTSPRCLVLAADTVVAFQGQMLGKPGDEGEAIGMLQTLQGQTHEVVTGVCLLAAEQGVVQTTSVWAETTRVTFRDLTPAEIAAYVKTGEPYDKAGAYGIQGRAAAFVSGVEGCYFNVVGLPLGSLCQRLNELGLPPWRQW